MKSRLSELLFVLLFSSCAYCLELPDEVHGWKCVNEYVVPLVLDVNSADMGTMTYRDYRRDSRTIQVIVAQGRGTGSLYVPERAGNAEGVMPSNSGYDIITVAGFKAVIEHHEYMPKVLAVNVSKDIVFTVEASDEESIIEFTENMLNKISKIY